MTTISLIPLIPIEKKTTFQKSQNLEFNKHMESIKGENIVDDQLVKSSAIVKQKRIIVVHGKTVFLEESPVKPDEIIEEVKPDEIIEEVKPDEIDKPVIREVFEHAEINTMLKQVFTYFRYCAGRATKDDEALLFEILINTKETIPFIYTEKVPLLVSVKPLKKEATQQEKESYKKALEEYNNQKRDIDMRKALQKRIYDFKFKLLTIYMLMYKLVNLGEHVSSGLQKELTGIINYSKTIVIQVKFTRHDRVDRVTPTSTIRLIVKHLQDLNGKLKGLLRPLALRYKLYHNENPVELANEIRDALEDIAPAGFNGIRKDHHYIIRLIIAKYVPQSFNPIQQKQWLSYYSEISELLRFTFLRKKEELPWSKLETNTQYINVPYSELNGNKPCSNNTFSRLITALNHFMPQVWALALFCIKDAKPLEVPPGLVIPPPPMSPPEPPAPPPAWRPGSTMTPPAWPPAPPAPPPAPDYVPRASADHHKDISQHNRSK
jgi:hypothetical protein